MDPNATLREIRTLIASLNRDEENPDFFNEAARLAELVAALDEWISRGGFLPVPWDREP